MSEIKTVARPYAKATFELALSQNDLKQWSVALNKLAVIAANKTMKPILSNPLVTNEELTNIFVGVGGDSLNDASKQLISLLAERKRLNLLPAIAKLFDDAVADHEKTIEVKVVSAYPIDSRRLQRMTHALQDKLKRQVSIECAVDTKLLGGAIIHAGDQVIDGSLRTKLKKLSERLCS